MANIILILLFIYQELLTRHKILCAEFLEQNYDKVFTHYQKLLNSDNYVTRRQALKVSNIYLYTDRQAG